METKWQDKYEYSMKEYLDELTVSCNREMPQTDNLTERQYFILLTKMVEEKFMGSVKVALKASEKAIPTNDISHAVDF